MKNTHPLVEVNNNTKGYLALPFDEEQFQDFVKGLLGKPQTITKRIKGTFEIYLSDLQNFHNLINQRITQQNHGKLLQLKTKIYFSDESSVMLSSYEELVTYNEVKPIISDSVKMTWSYLIQFADKNVPEKQEIELMIIASPFGNIIEDDDVPFIFKGAWRGEFRIQIQHTARSWGSDIESLLTNQVESMLIKCSPIREFISKKSFLISVIFVLLYLISLSLKIYQNYIEFVNENVKVIKNTIHSFGGNLSKKVDFLTVYIASDSYNNYLNKTVIFFMIYLVIGIFLGYWIESLADNRQKSFVILTRESVTFKDNYKKKSNRKIGWLIVSILFSISTGVIGNYLFAWLIKQ